MRWCGSWAPRSSARRCVHAAAARVKDSTFGDRLVKRSLFFFKCSCDVNECCSRASRLMASAPALHPRILSAHTGAQSPGAAPACTKRMGLHMRITGSASVSCQVSQRICERPLHRARRATRACWTCRPTSAMRTCDACLRLRACSIWAPRYTVDTTDAVHPAGLTMADSKHMHTWHALTMLSLVGQEDVYLMRVRVLIACVLVPRPAWNRAEPRQVVPAACCQCTSRMDKNLRPASEPTLPFRWQAVPCWFVCRHRAKQEASPCVFSSSCHSHCPRPLSLRCV